MPELFPTRVRATDMALSTSVPRFLTFLGPLVDGTLIANFGGLRIVSTRPASCFSASAFWSS